MTLQAGTRLGPYEIQSAIGAGGMGEVYKARDTRLDRTVAIKVLPEALAADPHFRERFDREARAISALDHPHICTLYDVGEQAPSTASTGSGQAGSGPAVAYLVMQYLEGETLAERLARKGGAATGERQEGGRAAATASAGRVGDILRVEDALQIAVQIAGALDRAHRAGIVHRDLKPGNIMLTKAGAKLLDFGLAKTTAPAVAVASSMAPTTLPSVTAAGAILGTFQYMAPEQIEGLEADARTDIFAFGAVLFEMLAGRQAFEGKTRASLLSAILKDEPPPVSQVRPGAPLALDRVVGTCLAKEPDDRWQTARDLLRELKWVADGTIAEAGVAGVAAPGSAGSTGPSLRRHRGTLPWAAAGALAAALAVVVTLWAPWQTAPPAAPIRFAIALSAAEALAASVTDRTLALSPDARHLVYVARGGQLMVRALDRVDAQPLRGIANTDHPFISPDGQWVGFEQGAELRKVSISGGPPITLCRIPGSLRGASWGPDEMIVFAATGSAGGLMRVAAGGGEPQILTNPDASQSEVDHYHPSLLPGGRAVLFTVFMPGGIDTSQVAVLDLETGQRKTLIRGGGAAQYVETGHLVYAAAGTLRAVRFDPGRLEVLSDPVPVVEGVWVKPVSGSAEYTVSRTGALVYMTGSGEGPARARSLVWVDRQGREEPIQAPPRAYYALRVSPDGARAALDIRDQENDVWVWDFLRRTLTRLTFDPGGDVFPVWTPDGRRIVFRRAGANALMARSADGTGVDEPLSAGPGLAMSFPPDGKSLLVSNEGDLGLVPMDGKGRLTPLLQTPTFAEGLAEISPDGRWLAYQSNESGQEQIYVRPFPDVNSGRWQVSPGGGTKPVWARNVGELFYLDAAGALTTVPIQTTPAFSAGNPTKLFDTRYLSAVNARSYDVSPDGRRFLVIKEMPAGADTSTATPASIMVVVNWHEELKRLVSTR